MLIDIVVRDDKGSDLYWSYFSTYHESNTLGPNRTKREDTILPYGLAYGEPLREAKSPLLFDFAITNGAKNEADMRENAKGILGQLYGIVKSYNLRNRAQE